MIYRKRTHSALPGGFFILEGEGSKGRMSGFGFGEHIDLRDEQGNRWHGGAERTADETVRYTFRDSTGRTISGVADGGGLVLRDMRGKTWRGFIE